jgi:putative secretion ATPase (PEP-CTERM system associated)
VYEGFFNLRERPFALSPDPEYLYRSRVHSEALSYLRYGIESHAGFIVITGEIGSGKTTLLQTALRGVDKHTAVARLVNTMLEPRELVEAVMLDFGMLPETGASKPRLLRQLAEYLVQQRAAGRLALLVIDEAQNLSQAALEEIRMLSNLETEKSKLIQIALVGQPDLRDLLLRPDLEQLRQRVTVSYHLPALDIEETAAYINHRLARAANGAALVFARDVTDLVHRHSMGVPRRINVIADAMLLYAYGEGQREIDVALTQKALDELKASGILTETIAPIAPLAPTGAAPGSWADLVAREERLVSAQQRMLLEQGHLLQLRRELQRTARIPDIAAPAQPVAAQPSPVAQPAQSSSVTQPPQPSALAQPAPVQPAQQMPPAQPAQPALPARENTTPAAASPRSTAGATPPVTAAKATPAPAPVSILSPSAKAAAAVAAPVTARPAMATPAATPREAHAWPEGNWAPASSSRRLFAPPPDVATRTSLWTRFGRGLFGTWTPQLRNPERDVHVHNS